MGKGILDKITNILNMADLLVAVTHKPPSFLHPGMVLVVLYTCAWRVHEGQREGQRATQCKGTHAASKDDPESSSVM